MENCLRSFPMDLEAALAAPAQPVSPPKKAQKSKPLSNDERGLVLVRLVYNGRSTAISMDVELWRLLAFLCGGEDQAKLWVREQGRLIEALSGTNTGVEAKGAGLSRLIQRRVYDLIGRRLSVVNN